MANNTKTTKVEASKGDTPTMQSPATAALEAPARTLLGDIDAAAQAAAARGDHHSFAVLTDLSVTAGALRHKAGEAVGRLQGADAKLAGKLRAAL